MYLEINTTSIEINNIAGKYFRPVTFLPSLIKPIMRLAKREFIIIAISAYGNMYFTLEAIADGFGRLDPRFEGTPV